MSDQIGRTPRWRESLSNLPTPTEEPNAVAFCAHCETHTERCPTCGKTEWRLVAPPAVPAEETK